MAKILLVHPGPDFSVADVYNGWRKALIKQGHQVKVYETNKRLMFYGRAVFEDHETDPCPECQRFPIRKALEDPVAVAGLSAMGMFEDLYKFNPEIVFFVSGFFQSGDNLRSIRQHGAKIVILHTESPYQDTEQMQRGQWAHLNLLNDPVNIEKWADLGIAYTAYVPHSYDPDIHYPDYTSEKTVDFSFVGTAFKSRCEFFSQLLPGLEADGQRIALGGNAWDLIDDEHKWLQKWVGHDPKTCVDNDETARIYRLSKTSVNFYRRESEDEHRGEGWAMGPREVELAASGVFFARDPRPESDAVFPMLPTFSDAEEAREKLVWYLHNDDARQEAADLALMQIQDRTFDNRAAEVMELMERMGIMP